MQAPALACPHTGYHTSPYLTAKPDMIFFFPFSIRTIQWCSAWWTLASQLQLVTTNFLHKLLTTPQISSQFRLSVLKGPLLQILEGWTACIWWNSTSYPALRKRKTSYPAFIIHFKGKDQLMNHGLEWQPGIPSIIEEGRVQIVVGTGHPLV